MDIVQKVLYFTVTLGVLIVIHELGHYAVARLAGVKVLRFSIGFGRVLWSRRFRAGGTEWAVSAIPLGGYVKMLDEREGAVAGGELRFAFNRQPVWKRIAVVVAGPLANLALAVLLFSGTFVAGIPGQRALLADAPRGSAAAEAGVHEGDVVGAVDGTPVQSWQDLRWQLLTQSGRDSVTLTLERRDGSRTEGTLPLQALAEADWESNFMGKLGLKADLGAPIIEQVVPGKPAARAGLRAGDRIVAIDGEPVRSPADVATHTNAHPGTALSFRVQRDGTLQDIDVVPEAAEVDGRKLGLAGIRLMVDPAVSNALHTTARYGPVSALAQGTRKTWELSVFTLRMLGRMLTGAASLKNISGPITMADYAGQSASAGPLAFVSYLALISISLGVLNLLPVPLLDGGHLLYYLAEILKGRPLSDRAFEVGQRIGMAVLAVLMALALFNDFSRLF